MRSMPRLRQRAALDMGLTMPAPTSLRILALLALGLATAAPARAADPQTVASVDLGRYAGKWYEIARLPNSFQSQCVSDVTAIYRARSDGRLDVVNRCRTPSGEIDEAVGVARVADQTTRAKLEVRFAPAFLSFLPFVWGDYWVLGLAPDYGWALVGSPDRQFLWLLARSPNVADADYGAALALATAQGFDVSGVVRTVHGEAATTNGAKPAGTTPSGTTRR
jgi:apolipoprotein D and lipocalin family protein